MSLPDRVAGIVSRRSRSIIVAFVLLTALIGAGTPMVDDDSSLEQFESDSAEAEALTYIDDNFGVDDDDAENTTSVQVITRASGDDDNVLSKDSLIASLEFQQEIYENETIEPTLAEDDPITGVENVLATTAVSNEQLAEVEADNQTLETGFEEVLTLQREYEAQNASGEDEAAAQTEAEIQEIIEATIDDADLDDEQAATFEERVGQAREVESERWAIEQQTDEPEANESYQELTANLEQLRAGATLGVLEAEYEAVSAVDPTLEEQITALEELDDDELEALIDDVLGGDGNDEVLRFMSTSYEPGSTTAEARMAIITQQAEGAGSGMEGASGPALDAQLDLRDLAENHDEDIVVFGEGIISDEIDRSLTDSFAIVGPLALLFVVATLAVAYRDLLDIALGVVGILAVLLWTFGFMGWADIAFNQMMIAVPVLLIGLSIDYAIHVFMRHREQREHPDAATDVRGSMRVALAGVGVALVWVTATAAIGFFANLVSPIGPIREFGIVNAVDIVAALLVFGALIPALKIELDAAFEARGYDRRKRAFGTGGGRFSRVLTVGSTAARKAPLLVLVLALLLTAGGVYGASQVDTSFNQEDFIAESPPGWTERLPGPMAPGEYRAADDLDFVNENFQRQDVQAQILLEGDLTGDTALERMADGADEAADSPVVYTLSNGEAEIQSPLSVMEDTAAQNESFNESFHAADTDDDGIPDENITALYDQLFEVNEAGASEVLYRTDDGEYEGARMIVATQGTAEFSETTSEMRAIAGTIDASGTGDQRNLDAGPGELNAFATGDPITGYLVEQALFETVLESLLITLVAVFAFLTIAYRVTGSSATLGVVTLLPVAFSVSWILGTMYLIGMPFNVLTGMITSLTVGLGVAYSIHVSSRYQLELERQGNVWEAMRTTVTGTGGALLGSAATTVGGFGTLAFAIFPVLQQFGIITGLTITYAFLASIIVLPALLVVWTRYFGPNVSFEWDEARPAAVVDDGGADGDGPAPETGADAFDWADGDGPVPADGSAPTGGPDPATESPMAGDAADDASATDETDADSTGFEFGVDVADPDADGGPAGTDGGTDRDTHETDGTPDDGDRTPGDDR